MNQPCRGFQEKTQYMPFPFLIGACTCDAGDEGAFIYLPGQGCVDMNNGYFCGGHEVLFDNKPSTAYRSAAKPIDNTIELPMATRRLGTLLTNCTNPCLAENRIGTIR